MKSLFLTLTTVSFACAVSACSSMQPVTNPNGSEAVVSQGRASHEGRGELAMQNGQAWTATNLFKQATARHDTQLNRFNLAAAYERTGRYKEAARYYQSVIDDGRTLAGPSIPNNQIADNKSQPSEVVSESMRRIPMLGADRGEKAMFSNARKVGGPTFGDVSDAEAARLDKLAMAMAQ